MSETITTTQLLDFLAKAHKVSSHVNLTKETGVYRISVYADWDDDNDFCDRNTCITEKGHFTWGHCFTRENSDYEFFEMDSLLDELVEKEEERKLKRRKREELLSRLTDEEKELLGVN